MVAMVEMEVTMVAMVEMEVMMVAIVEMVVTMARRRCVRISASAVRIVSLMAVSTM